jgi:hypothetical protein
MTICYCLTTLRNKVERRRERMGLEGRGGKGREEKTREEKRREKWGGSERHYIWGWEQETPISGLKVPRQCPLVLLVEVMCMIGINLSRRWKGCIIVKFDLTFRGLH